jgi:pSer/pThr/pTyr-binding forkhead associated (FHA) protein
MATHLNKSTHIHGLRIAYPEEAVEICAEQGCHIGRGVDNHITLDSPAVSMRHARLFKQEGDFWIEDLGSREGTWLNGSKMRAQQRQRVSPGDEVTVGEKGSPSHTFYVKRVHRSVWDQVKEVEGSMDEPQEEMRTAVVA